MGQMEESVKTQSVLRTDSGDVVRDACIDGIGIAINSTWSVFEHLQKGELVEILSDYSLVSDTAIWALYPSSRQVAPKVRAFIDFYAARFADPRARPLSSQKIDGSSLTAIAALTI